MIDLTPKPVFTDLDKLAYQRKLDAIQSGYGYTGIDERHKRLMEQTRPNHTAPQRSTLTFYRVEDHSGKGPYRYEVDYPLTNGRYQHPLPDQDGIDWWDIPGFTYYLFGFADLEDLHGWFEPDALARLINARNREWDFRVTRYEVTEASQIIHGYRQAIAKRTDLRYCETIDIRSLI